MATEDKRHQYNLPDSENYKKRLSEITGISDSLPVINYRN